MSTDLTKLAGILEQRVKDYEKPFDGEDRLAFYKSAAYPICETLGEVARAIRSINQDNRWFNEQT